METIVIAVDCKDLAYSHRLAEALGGAYDDFIIYLHDTEEKCVDVVVTDKKDRDKDPDVAKVFLCEKKYDADIQENYCFKYGAVSAIVAAILSAFTKTKGKVIRMTDETECPCIGVVSAAGGTGATTLAKGLAQHFVINVDKKVLVVSLDDFLPLEDNFRRSRFSLRQYLYFLEEGNLERISSADMFTCKDQYGVAYFTPDAVRNSFFEASGELAAEMIHHLKKDWGFDVIVLDVGGKPAWIQEKILPHCNTLVCMVSAKDAAYIKAMESLGVSFENTCYVCTAGKEMKYENERAWKTEEQTKKVLEIPWVEDCPADDFDFFNRVFQGACSRIAEAIGQ